VTVPARHSARSAVGWLCQGQGARVAGPGGRPARLFPAGQHGLPELCPRRFLGGKFGAHGGDTQRVKGPGHRPQPFGDRAILAGQQVIEVPPVVRTGTTVRRLAV
jgi:hypothetical protein